MSYSTCLIGLVYESRSTCLNLMAEITMAKQLLASEPCRLPACIVCQSVRHVTTFTRSRLVNDLAKQNRTDLESGQVQRVNLNVFQVVCDIISVPG